MLRMPGLASVLCACLLVMGLSIRPEHLDGLIENGMGGGNEAAEADAVVGKEVAEADVHAEAGRACKFMSGAKRKAANGNSSSLLTKCKTCRSRCNRKFPDRNACRLRNQYCMCEVEMQRCVSVYGVFKKSLEKREIFDVMSDKCFADVRGSEYVSIEADSIRACSDACEESRDCHSMWHKVSSGGRISGFGGATDTRKGAECHLYKWLPPDSLRDLRRSDWRVYIKRKFHTHYDKKGHAFKGDCW